MSILSKDQVDQWKNKGWVVAKNLVNVKECIESMKNQYPENEQDPILDFGSGGKTEFPCKYDSLNKMTLNIKLIKAVKQLLNTQNIRLTQSIAWAKYGVPAKNEQSNCEQRIHMDYGNNTWLHPPKWDEPNVVAAIIYYSNTNITGGSTAVVSRQGDDDPVYEFPYIHMPGIAGKPFFNSKDAAERSVSGKTKKIRDLCYKREVKSNPNKGDVLFYRLDVWHRGTPVNKGKVRYVHNLAWKKADAIGINTWNSGWSKQMYYGWLEKLMVELNDEQREILGFPCIKTLPKYMQKAVYARYPGLSKL